MFCFRYRRLLIPYSEHGLAERTAAKVEAHLAGCASCAAELRMLQSVSNTLRQSNDSTIEPAHDLWARVNERIAGEIPAPAKTLWRLLPQVATATAGALLIVVVGLSLWRTAPPTQQARVQEAKSASPKKSAGPHDVAAKKIKMPAMPPQRKVMLAKAPIAESPSTAPIISATTASGGEIDIKHDNAPQSLYSDRNKYYGVATEQKDKKAELSQAAGVTNEPSPGAPVTVAADSSVAAPSFGLAAKSAPPAEAQTEISGASASCKSAGTSAELAKESVSVTLEAALKLVKEHPDQPANWLKLGEAYEAAGNKADAIAAYTKAAEGSDAEVAATAKGKLKHAILSDEL